MNLVIEFRCISFQIIGGKYIIMYSLYSSYIRFISPNSSPYTRRSFTFSALKLKQKNKIVNLQSVLLSKHYQVQGYPQRMRGVDTKHPITKCPKTKHPKQNTIKQNTQNKTPKISKCPKLQNVQSNKIPK